MNEQRRRWVWVLAWLVFQLLLTSLPGRMLPDLDSSLPIDKVAHVGMYGMLGLLLVRATLTDTAQSAGPLGPLGRLLLLAAAISSLGAVDELHQLFIPGRAAEVGDWLADTIGGVCGLATGFLLMKTRWAVRWLR